MMSSKAFLLKIILIHTLIVITTTQSFTYETKYDNVDLDEVLQSERLLKNYIKCLEYEGPCTPDGKILRDNLPDAISNNCSKCSERQKYGSDKVTHFLIDQKPEVWQRLELRYDPEGTFRKRYLETTTTSLPATTTTATLLLTEHEDQTSVDQTTSLESEN